MKYGIKDRITDLLRNVGEKLSLNKESLIHIGLAAGVAVIISAIIAVGVSPSTEGINADIARLDESDQALTNIIDALDGQNAAAILALHGINTTVSGQVASIDDLAVLLATLQTEFNNLVCSPPDAYLDGTFGDYTLYVKSSNAGEFIANVHLVYSPPIVAGNATNYSAAIQTFYSGINWTTANQFYIPTAAYNGAAWIISRVSFSIGPFTLEADHESIIDIIVSGLVYEPTYSYVEVYPILGGLVP